MRKRRLRTGDEVLVISGNDRGRFGKILAFKDDRVIVEGINVKKKHRKPRQEGQKGQIIDVELPLHISNVKPSVGGKAVKLKVRFNEEGEKELFYIDGENALPFRSKG
jgi:large subunit ribosomal protein L24